MARTVFLHVGMPKCASTSVQMYLDDIAGDLAAAGIHFERHPASLPGGGNATDLARAVLARDRAGAGRMLDHFLRHDGDVILSSEDMVALAHGAVLEDFLDQIAARSHGVRVICYLRRQDLWIESDFKQHVTQGSAWDGPIEDLLRMRRQDKTLNYLWLMRRWARCVGHDNLTVVPLAAGQKPERAVERLLEALGAPDLARGGMPVRPGNVSAPCGLIEPARLLKRAWIAQGVAPQDTALRIDVFLRAAARLVPVPQRRFLLPHPARQRLVAQYAAANRQLGEEFLGGALPFDDVVEADDPDAPGLAEEAGALLARYLAASALSAPPGGRLRGVRRRVVQKIAQARRRG